MRKVWLMAALALGGCGTTAQNADVPQGIYTGLEGRPTIAEEKSVVILDMGPTREAGGMPVSGLSCKNKVWQDPPSPANVLALMKRQAAKKGFTAVHSVSVHDDPGALVKNCWNAVIAEGIAFNPPSAAGSPRR